MEISMTGIQTLAAGFAVFMMYLTFLHFKRNDFNRYQFVVWETMLIGFLVVTLLPNQFNLLTEQLGITRAFDLFAIVAFIVILFLTFHNYLLISKLEKRIKKTVSDKALEGLKKE